MSNTSIDVLLSLLRAALLRCDEPLPSSVNWPEVMKLAAMHGLAAVAYDGIERLVESQVELALDNKALTEMPKSIKLQWAALCLRQESLSKFNWMVACRLSDLWKNNGIEALLLKGRSIAQFYPKPQHRYSCDLDVFIAGEKWEKACDVLEKQGISLVYEVYKEVEFTYNGLYVECHRYITPVRGNKTLLRLEKYLRSLLEENPVEYFEGTTLRCPPLNFIVLLYLEHALGDLLHGHISLKHIVDWVVIRHQEFDRKKIEHVCKEFGFDRFLNLVDALADVVEGARNIDSLSIPYKEVFDSLFSAHPSANKPKTWFERRLSLFFEIMRNRKNFRKFGYCSMPNFLFNAVWCHFFNKTVNL